MSKVRKSEPVFPGTNELHLGISQRDLFLAIAVHGMLASGRISIHDGARVIAERAAEIADEMCASESER